MPMYRRYTATNRTLPCHVMSCPALPCPAGMSAPLGPGSALAGEFPYILLSLCLSTCDFRQHCISSQSVRVPQLPATEPRKNSLTPTTSVPEPVTDPELTAVSSTQIHGRMSSCGRTISLRNNDSSNPSYVYAEPGLFRAMLLS